jgi:hypothetical protein
MDDGASKGAGVAATESAVDMGANEMYINCFRHLERKPELTATKMKVRSKLGGSYP